MLKEKFGPKREVTREDVQIHIGDLHDLYSTPNIIRVIKSPRMKCVVHVASMGERRVACRLLVGKPDGKVTTWIPKNR